MIPRVLSCKFAISFNNNYSESKIKAKVDTSQPISFPNHKGSNHLLIKDA